MFGLESVLVKVLEYFECLLEVYSLDQKMSDMEVFEGKHKSLLRKGSRLVKKKVKVEGALFGAWVNP